MARKKSEFLSAFGKAFEIFKGISDEVLEIGGDDSDLVKVLRENQLRRQIAELIVKKKSVDTITRTVRVDYDKAPLQLIDETNRTQYTDKSVVETMPALGSGIQEVEVHFFNPGRVLNDKEVAEEYEKRGLVPDPYALAQVNIDDPAFTNEHPNGCNWKDKDGRWCFAAFHRVFDERYVHVNRYGGPWYDRFWFAGVRKIS